MKSTERLPRQVRVLIMARAVNQLGGFSLAFLTVLLADDFGAGLTAAGVVSAAFGLATIPSRLLGGRLADGWGRRRTIVAGLLGCAAAQLGLAAAPNLALAAVSALLLGLAFELFEPPSQSLIADSVPPHDRASAFGLLTTAIAVGSLGAGLIADVVGRWSLRWLFVADAATGIACAAIVLLALAPDAVAKQSPAAGTDAPIVPDAAVKRHPAVGDGAPIVPDAAAKRHPAAGDGAPIARPAARAGVPIVPPSAKSELPLSAGSGGPAAGSEPLRPTLDVRSPWRDRALLAVTASGTVFALISMLFLVALPISLSASGLRPSDAGLLMAASTLTLVLARPILRTGPVTALSHSATFAIGYLLMAAGLLAYAAAHTLPTLVLPTALYSLGNLLVMGRSFAVVSELAPPAASARYLAVYGLSWGVATLLAPLVVAWLVGASGPGALWSASGVVCGGMAVVQPVLARRVAGVGVIHSTNGVAERYDAVSI